MIRLAIDILFSAVAALLSLFLRRQFAKHRLRIGRISLPRLSLFDVQYSGVLFGGTYHFTFVASRITLRFHWPCHPNPKIVTFAADNILYRSTTADVSTGRLTVVLWFFPVLFRQTAGPWVNAELDDFRIRIFGSDATPHFVKELRENLVRSLLTGDVLRLDDFGTRARFTGVTERAVEDGEDSDRNGQHEHPSGSHYTTLQDRFCHGRPADHNGAASESVANDHGTFSAVMNSVKAMQPQPSRGREHWQDEVRISSFARGLMLHNKEGRMYSFGALDAQLRRNWTANRGNFVMIAKEARWVRVPCLYQMRAPPSLWK